MALIRGTTRRPKVTLKELDRSIAQMVEALDSHEAGLYGKVARRKLLLKKKFHVKFCIGDSASVKKLYSVV